MNWTFTIDEDRLPRRTPKPLVQYEDQLRLIPRPTLRIHATFPTPTLFTDPVTHEIFHLRNRRGSYWYVLEELDVKTDRQGTYFYSTKRIHFRHWLKFRHYIPGAWASPSTP